MATIEKVRWLPFFIGINAETQLSSRLAFNPFA